MTSRQHEASGDPVMAVCGVWQGMTQEELVADGFCTPKEAWEFLGIGHSSLYKMMASGELPYVVLLSGVRRIPKAALKKLAADRLVLAGESA